MGWKELFSPESYLNGEHLLATNAYNPQDSFAYVTYHTVATRAAELCKKYGCSFLVGVADKDDGNQVVAYAQLLDENGNVVRVASMGIQLWEVGSGVDIHSAARRLAGAASYLRKAALMRLLDLYVDYGDDSDSLDMLKLVKETIAKEAVRCEASAFGYALVRTPHGDVKLYGLQMARALGVALGKVFFDVEDKRSAMRDLLSALFDRDTGYPQEGEQAHEYLLRVLGLGERIALTQYLLVDVTPDGTNVVVNEFALMRLRQFYRDYALLELLDDDTGNIGGLDGAGVQLGQADEFHAD